MFRAPVAIALFTLPVPAQAQQAPDPLPAESLRLEASVRARYEVLRGNARAGVGANDDLLAIRTLIFGEYETGPVRMGAELQDSRVYGADPGSATGANDVNALELVQAYIAADIERPLGPASRLSVQAGRFTLNLGSRRLVAADDYRNTTNGSTGVRVDATFDRRSRATLIYTLAQLRLPDDPLGIQGNRVAIDRESDALVLWGGIASHDLTTVRPVATIDGSFFRLTEEDRPGRPTRDRQLSTASLRLILAPAPQRFDVEVELIGQWGNISASLAANAPTLPVRAWFVHADTGYTFSGPLRPRLSVEVDAASGDAPGGRFGRFDTLFGMRRADLAPAGIYAQIGRANIITPGIRLELAPAGRWDAFFVHRLLWLEDSRDAFSTTGVRDTSGASGRFAGSQMEGRVRVWLIPDRLRLEVNGALLFKGRFLEDAPNAPSNDPVTRYISTALTVQL